MLHRLLSTLVCSAVLLLTACENYDFKVNEKVVYTPRPLFKDFDTPDAALRTCLEQAIADGTITAANQLVALSCSHAGIESLDGISSFSGLTTIQLSSNKIRNLVEIGSIATLEELYLDNNQIVDPVPLYQLPVLRLVDLAGNPGLQCPKPGRFARVANVTLPDHCR